jgi:2-oxo-4-hydroxy-4-carboxy--5-ureidoimidazoline (OHCU) decarboxylase
MPRVPAIAELNALPEDEFVRTLLPLFEGGNAFLGRVAAGRPYATFAALFRESRTIAADMPAVAQIELLNAHPRIGADPGAVSVLSYTEQGYDRAPAQADAEVARRLHELNDAYEAKFGFRFVVFVAGRPRAEIVPLLEASLDAERDAELRRGLDDVVSIAEDRMRTARGVRGQAISAR